MIVLKPHQEEAADFLRQRNYAILADSPRLGKTFPTVVVALERLQSKQTILIVVPSGVKYVWRDAINDLSIKGTTHIYMVDGQVSATKGPPATFYGAVIVPWGLIKFLPAKYKPQILILDEVHRMQSKTAQRTKAALKLMDKASIVYALSGTLMLNRPINLWSVLSGLKITKMAWYDYAHHFCKAWVAPWGLDVSGAANLPELKALIKPHILRRSKDQVFKGYTPPEYRLITFDRPVSKQESRFNKDELTTLQNPILSIEGLSEILHEAAIKKLPDCIDFITGLLNEEPEMKIVVFGYHIDVIDGLAAGLKTFRPVTVKGDTPMARREARRTIFMTRPECRVFIGNIIACSEGIDLSIADTVAFVETTWSPSLLEQATARVENLNKVNSAALAYLLTIETSLDHYILQTILKKMSVISQVIPSSTAPPSVTALPTKFFTLATIQTLTESQS